MTVEINHPPVSEEEINFLAKVFAPLVLDKLAKEKEGDQK